MKSALTIDQHLVLVPALPEPEMQIPEMPMPSVWLPRLLLFWLCVVLAAAWCVGLSLLFS